MAKMAVERTGVVEKHCSAFTLFSNGFCPQTNKVHIKKRTVNEVRLKEDRQKL
jgi:hypothetical protein